MKPTMRLSALRCLLACGHAALGIADAEIQDVKNIAIIGAGAAGSSTAYHLQRFAEDAGLAVNMTIFEKTDRVGGRTLTVNALDDPSEPVELGASIFVEANRILYNATQTFGLPLGEMSDGQPGAVTAIWDGERIVYSSTSGQSWWWDAARLWWRYGMSPYRTVSLVNKVVAQFLQMYEEPWFPFRSLTQRAFELDLGKITGMTGEQFLEQNKIRADFSREIIQAASRVNYASNLACLHGLDSMVSFAADGAMAVTGGNWQIFDRMVESSGATLHRDTTVTSMTNKGHTGAPKYVISTTADASAAPADNPVGFDSVVIASPWQFSNIAADGKVLRHTIEPVPYTKLHVTLFTTAYRLRPGYFGLEPGAKAPSNVYTTLGSDEDAQCGAKGVGRTGFYSISTLRTVTNPRTGQREFVYKIFSPEKVTVAFLSDILGVDVPGETVDEGGVGGEASPSNPISWFYPTWFHSYPLSLPRVTFQDPVVGEGVYYTSGMESFISTMETSALMGMNVARLMVNDLAGGPDGAVTGQETMGRGSEL